VEFDEYQELARRTMNNELVPIFEDRLANFALGVAGESGEIADYLKKVLFHGHPLDRAKLADELGDVLWYVAALATTADLTMNELATANVAKLRRRYPDGFSQDDSRRRVDVRAEEST